MSEVEREYMEYDVVIVGAGPSGLSAAIRLRQLAEETGQDISVCVLEKGSEVGAHILSGAVMDPSALNELIPDWKEKGAPLNTPVESDEFYVLGEAGQLRVPNFMMPPLMNNHGNYIVSLGNVCRWLGEQAEAMGVEIYPGFAAAELIRGDNGEIKGVVTGDMGVDREGNQKDGMYQAGMELRAKYTLIGEGARGSLAKDLIREFNLDANSDHAKFGIGVKELWEIDPAKHSEGRVMHSFGWPLGFFTGGGAFCYHLENNTVAIGFVVHLNYTNPYLSPFEEFQRMKQHPLYRDLLEGGKRISYGARAITEGGLQSVPKMTFPGGILMGCSAGLVNVPRIKGTHNAMKSGMLAAESAFEAVQNGQEYTEVQGYQKKFDESSIYKDLSRVRNVKPLWSKFGLAGVALGGIDMWLRNLNLGITPTLKHGKPDYATLKPASESKQIEYPKPDGVISFDRLSSVFVSNTNHEEDQPVHLKLTDPNIPINVNLEKWAEPAQRYCPAGVYEIVRDDDGTNPRFQINAQNCVHCKTCDIKDPSQNINWKTPEGMGGPNYPNM